MDRMMAARPDVGDPAPDFRLPGSDGQEVALKDLLGEGPVVLLFVPRPTTGVCAKTAAGLRRRYERLEAQGARLIGISPMSGEVHDRLVEEHHLPFHYLSDPGGKVAKRYDIRPVMGLVPGRATFGLDADGIVRRLDRSPVSAQKHIETALQGVEKIGVS